MTWTGERMKAVVAVRKFKDAGWTSLEIIEAKKAGLVEELLEVK